MNGYPSQLTRALRLALFIALVTEPAVGDELVINADSVISRVPLPAGSPEPDLLQLSDFIREVAYLDDGRLLAIRELQDDGGFTIGFGLAEVEGDGTVVDIGTIEPPDPVFGLEEPLDLVVDSDGRLFFLSFVPLGWNPPDGYSRLVELNLDDASSVSSLKLAKMTWLLARAPSQLWAQTLDGLERLDPDNGQFTFVRYLETFANDGETDSSGALWLYREGVCSPPCFFLSRFDPATGSERALDSPDLNPASILVRDLTIRRLCQNSPTTLCVQGGRFKVEVDWKDFENRQGQATLTDSRSADSGVFYFFDPANWELTVKVLDGCGLGGHYWVFASGSTNVQYTLTVTDLQTGRVRSYDNPLGQTAITVTDTSAFPCG